MRLYVCGVIGLLVGGAGAVAMGCGGGPTVPIEPVPFSVAITPDSVNLPDGQAVQLTVVVRDSTGAPLAGVPIAFFASDPSVASVTAGGLVAGVRRGTAAITAVVSASVTDEVPVVVTPVPGSVVVTPGTVQLRAGQTLQLGTTVLDADSLPMTGVPVTFTSTNAGVASVTPAGLVTGESAGTAGIVATVTPAVSTQVPATIRRVPPLGVVGSPDVPCAHGIALAGTGVGYVTQLCMGAATRFDVAGPTTTGDGPVGVEPAHVAMSPDGSTAYVVNQSGGSLMVVNVATNSTTDTIPLGDDGFNVLASPDGAYVYVTTAGGTAYKMNAATHVLVDTVQVSGFANGLALHPTQPTLYIASIFAATVAAINTTTFTVTRTYTVGGQIQRIAASPDGTELYVANLNGLSIVNLGAGDVTPVNLGATETIGLAVDPLGQYAYLAVPAEQRVAVVDLVDRAFFGDINTGVGSNPRNIAIGTNLTVVISDLSGKFHVVR